MFLRSAALERQGRDGRGRDEVEARGGRSKGAASMRARLPPAQHAWRRRRTRDVALHAVPVRKGAQAAHVDRAAGGGAGHGRQREAGGVVRGAKIAGGAAARAQAVGVVPAVRHAKQLALEVIRYQQRPVWQLLYIHWAPVEAGPRGGGGVGSRGAALVARHAACVWVVERGCARCVSPQGQPRCNQKRPSRAGAATGTN